MSDRTLARTLLRVPRAAHHARPLGAAATALAGLVLSPFYLARASARGTPGVSFRRRCSAIGLRQLFAVENRLTPLELYQLIAYPMDSVRYFEFDFAWSCLSEAAVHKYLDVSSPRLLPLLVVRERQDVEAVLLNPDRNDLPVTARFARAMGIDRQCRFATEVVDSVDLTEESMDLVTCLSVLEHIPEDRQAVARMWRLVKPGGRMILTVPCAAIASEEYVDQDKYGLLQPDDDGYVFWQRYYDARMLEDNVFSETGAPARMRVYGELRAGSYARNVEQKMRGPWDYPFWREPYMMATEYRYFDSVNELPGMGVVGMEFRKQ